MKKRNFLEEKWTKCENKPAKHFNIRKFKKHWTWNCKKNNKLEAKSSNWVSYKKACTIKISINNLYIQTWFSFSFIISYSFFSFIRVHVQQQCCVVDAHVVCNSRSRIFNHVVKTWKKKVNKLFCFFYRSTTMAKIAIESNSNCQFNIF